MLLHDTLPRLRFGINDRTAIAAFNGQSRALQRLASPSHCGTGWRTFDPPAAGSMKRLRSGSPPSESRPTTSRTSQTTRTSFAHEPHDDLSYPIELPPLQHTERSFLQRSHPPLPTVEPKPSQVSPTTQHSTQIFHPRSTPIQTTSSTRDAAPADYHDARENIHSTVTSQSPRNYQLGTHTDRQQTFRDVGPQARSPTCRSTDVVLGERGNTGSKPATQAYPYASTPVIPRYRTLSKAPALSGQEQPLIERNTFLEVPRETPILEISQQPQACRACGFGERDRRVIDPPPILSLHDAGGAATSDSIIIVHASLWDEHGTRDITHAQESNRKTGGNLMGNLVASCINGTDEHGRAGKYFIFTDLSCRTYGRYRLRFSLVSIPAGPALPGTKAPILAHVMSDVLVVHTAKDFPGMRPSSALARSLKEQGHDIPLKKGKRSGLSMPGDYQSDTEDEEGHGGKRRKT